MRHASDSLPRFIRTLNFFCRQEMGLLNHGRFVVLRFPFDLPIHRELVSP
jgi:hypothetical protein